METFSALLAICAGNSPVPGEFPTQRPVTRSFDVYFDLRPNKWLSKQPWGWWFETLSCSLWRHRNAVPHDAACLFSFLYDMIHSSTKDLYARMPITYNMVECWEPNCLHNVTWSLRHLISPVMRLFVQKFILVKTNHQRSALLAFCAGNIIFPKQRASDANSVLMTWLHHAWIYRK